MLVGEGIQHIFSLNTTCIYFSLITQKAHRRRCWLSVALCGGRNQSAQRKKPEYPEEETGVSKGRNQSTQRKKLEYPEEETAVPRGRNQSTQRKKLQYPEEETRVPRGRKEKTGVSRGRNQSTLRKKPEYSEEETGVPRGRNWTQRKKPQYPEEEIGVPRGRNHQPWMGNHYPATCRYQEWNLDRSSGKRGFYPCAILVVLQQSSNKSLSFRDGPTGGTSFVNIYQNVRLDP